VSMKLKLIRPSGQPDITNGASDIAEILLTVSLYVKSRLALNQVKEESNDVS